MKNESKLLDAEDLSIYLSVKIGTIYQWVSQKRIPFVKLGRCVRFDITKIDHWKDQKSIKSIDI